MSKKKGVDPFIIFHVLLLFFVTVKPAHYDFSFLLLLYRP